MNCCSACSRGSLRRNIIRMCSWGRLSGARPWSDSGRALRLVLPGSWASLSLSACAAMQNRAASTATPTHLARARVKLVGCMLGMVPTPYEVYWNPSSQGVDLWLRVTSKITLDRAPCYPAHMYDPMAGNTSALLITEQVLVF